MAEVIYPGSAAFNQATLDALAKTNKATVKGFALLAGHFFESARQSFENAIEVNRTLMSIKTPAELAEFQTKLAQESFANAVERGKALSELTTIIAKEVTASFGDPAIAASNTPVRQKGGGAKAS